MKVLLVLCLAVSQLHGQSYEDRELGLSLSLPDNWKSAPVVEANKPFSVFEAIRDNKTDEFLTVVVYPSPKMAISKDRAANWAKEIVYGLNGLDEDTVTARVEGFPSGQWYAMQVKFQHGNLTYCYSTVLNGFSYNFSFMSKFSQFDKKFQKETVAVIKSVLLTKPTAIETIKRNFDILTNDTVNSLLRPKDYFYSKTVTEKQVPPFAYTLYSELIAQKNTDIVLIAMDPFQQLFCLNIKYESKVMSTVMLNIVSVMVSKQFEKNGHIYEELNKGPWSKNTSIYLHKFRLTKPKSQAQTTHYIFYVTRKDRMDIWKLQVPTTLESEFDSLFEKWAISSF